MIYTVTCNPALDYIARVNAFEEGATNRSLSDSLVVGGKGINVSTVLALLGLPTVALGFVAGITGRAVEVGLDGAGIQHDFIHLNSGNTRVNLKLKHATEGEWAPDADPDDAATAPAKLLETEINGRGPYVDAEAYAQLHNRVEQLQAGDTLVLSGSKAAGMDNSAYFELASAVPEGVRVVVDATGDLLLNALPAKPFLIKPNNEELAALDGCDAHDVNALVAAAQSLVARGAQYVLVSCGAGGAFLVDEGGLVARTAAAKGALVNSVGAGDSMVAGFIAGWEGVQLGSAQGSIVPEDPEYALKLGAAAGSATAFSVGLATREKIAALLA